MRQKIFRFMQGVVAVGIFTSLPADANAATGTHIPCAFAVTNANDAAAKADWIVEANIAFLPIGESRSFVVEKPKVVRKRWWNTKATTVSLQFGECLSNETWRRASSLKQGDRVRFYGNAHFDSPAKRAFYVEPANLPLPSKQGLLPESYRSDLSAPQGEPMADGWYRSRSTEGRFTVDVPAPYIEGTLARNGTLIVGISSKDAHGVLYMVQFEPSHASMTLVARFDATMQQKLAVESKFRGAQAVYHEAVMERDNRPVSTASKLIRVPGGTFWLGIAAPKGQEKAAFKQRERFFNSLQVL